MLIKELNKYKKNHENSENQKLFYTKVRSGKPKSNINISARFLYLNKACFNGLYRVNSNNEFNVPFNGSKKINIYDEDNINNINKYLSENKIKIFNKDYLSILDMSKDGDFIFCDPPYDTDTNQFTSYTKDCFSRKNQVDLFNKLVELNKKNIKWMITNHDTDFIKELYKDFNSTIVKVNRSINSKGNNRKNSCNEIIITNYDAGIS